MTTTDFIKLLTENEFGGATGRPREVMFEVDDEIFETDGIEVTGSGDGLFTELFLSLPNAKRKTGKWIGYNADNQNWLRTDGSPVFLICSECGQVVVNNFSSHWNYCSNCGCKMEVEE